MKPHSTLPEGVRPSPWDSEVFGIDCYEIDPTPAALAFAGSSPGHFTVKVDPLADKGPLHRAGFYYADSLIEPACTRPRLHERHHPDCSIRRIEDVELLTPICRKAFAHGRFHRDFNLDTDLADRRYIRWLHQLSFEGVVYGLFFRTSLAGFVACRQNHLMLHAMAGEFRGQGLAGYFWTRVCESLFDEGFEEVRSSISAVNLAALNLYASLGFRFSRAVDVYHRLND
ncbi:MAG: GNAT family N-acetyltransferase [Caldilineae bacterium]|nr:MAG: GNAT family N-acetyltransferase [Caldilineae bacterium]